MRKETEALVQVGPPMIQTAEDARWRYLQGVIDEDELKEILGRFGTSLEPTSLVAHPNSFERLDDAFERKLPDVPDLGRDRLEDRLRRVEAKEKAREAAEKKAPKPEDVEVKSSVTAVVDPNQPSKEAYEKVLEKEIPKIEDQKTQRIEKELKEEAKESRQARQSTK